MVEACVAHMTDRSIDDDVTIVRCEWVSTMGVGEFD